jgi:hypothetical protein
VGFFMTEYGSFKMAYLARGGAAFRYIGGFRSCMDFGLRHSILSVEDSLDFLSSLL